MAQQVIGIGTNANDGTGDTLRVAMDKINDNFTEVYTAPGISSDAILISGNQIAAIRSNDDLIFQPAGTGTINFPAIRFNDNNIEGVCEYMFIDTGKIVRYSEKEPPLMTTTICVDIDLAREIYERLLVQGWKKTEEVWTRNNK